MTVGQFVILALATWRLSFMFSREDGPFDLFRRVRLFLGAREVVTGAWTAQSMTGKLVLCPLCLSVWVAAFLYLAIALLPILWPVAYVLALSAVACVLQAACFSR